MSLPALEVRGLRKAFGAIQALDGLDLVVEPGQMVGFLGPNGAGKTTTMRATVGLTSIDAGEVLWKGKPIRFQDRRHIGYMPQERGLYARMRVHEHIAFIGRIAGLDDRTANRRAHEWIERVGLEERADDMVQELSTGNQQRVQLAVALVHGPELLILDEPFSGLDPVAVATLTGVMTEQAAKGVSIIFSSHQLELVQDLTEYVTIVSAGRNRATGRVADLRQRSPHRILGVRWAAEPPTWRPPDGEPIGPARGNSRFRVPADVDPAALIAAAAHAGPIASVTFEPPSLEEVFLELVTP